MRQYYIHGGQFEKGPLNLEQLQAESLQIDTPVWYEGLDGWTTAGKIEELKNLFVKKTTPPPLPKLPEKNVELRDKFLNSFSVAQEIEPGKEPKNRTVSIVIISIIIVIGVIITYLFYR